MVETILEKTIKWSSRFDCCRTDTVYEFSYSDRDFSYSKLGKLKPRSLFDLSMQEIAVGMTGEEFRSNLRRAEVPKILRYELVEWYCPNLMAIQFRNYLNQLYLRSHLDADMELVRHLVHLWSKSTNQYKGLELYGGRNGAIVMSGR